MEPQGLAVFALLSDLQDQVMRTDRQTDISTLETELRVSGLFSLVCPVFQNTSQHRHAGAGAGLEDDSVYWRAAGLHRGQRNSDLE